MTHCFNCMAKPELRFKCSGHKYDCDCHYFNKFNRSVESYQRTIHTAWVEEFNNRRADRYEIAEHDGSAFNKCGVNVSGEWEKIKEFIADRECLTVADALDNFADAIFESLNALNCGCGCHKVKHPNKYCGYCRCKHQPVSCGWKCIH